MKKADKAPKKRSVLKGSKTATVLEMIFSLMTIPLALVICSNVASARRTEPGN